MQQITSRRDSESRVDITIIPGPHASDAHKRSLDAYCPRILSTEDFRAEFPRILDEVGLIPLAIKGAEWFVGLDCQFIALAGGRIQAVPEEPGEFSRWRT